MDIRTIRNDSNSELKIFKKDFIPEKWLYENCNQLKNLSSWLEELSITNEQVHYMKKNDKKAHYLYGISKILPENEREDCPIKFFDINKNKIYIKNKDDWHLIKKDEITLIQDVLAEKIWQEWEREKVEKNIKDIELDVILKGGGYNTDKIQETIRKTLNKCNVLKLSSLIVPVFELQEE